VDAITGGAVADAAMAVSDLSEAVRSISGIVEFLYGPHLDSWNLLRRKDSAGSDPLEMNRVADLIRMSASNGKVVNVSPKASARGATTQAAPPPLWLVLSPSARTKVRTQTWCSLPQLERQRLPHAPAMWVQLG